MYPLISIAVIAHAFIYWPTTSQVKDKVIIVIEEKVLPVITK